MTTPTTPRHELDEFCRHCRATTRHRVVAEKQKGEDADALGFQSGITYLTMQCTRCDRVQFDERRR
jgi:hypothetical protein